MNQHFVPEFYLKNFSPNGKQIFVYDKILQKSFTSSISSVASKDSFYHNSNNNSIENIIGNVEARTGIIIKKLIKKLENDQFSKITFEEKDILLKFIWLQMTRTIESRIQSGSIRPNLYSKLTNTTYEIDANKMLKDIEIIDGHIDFLNSSLENPFALSILRSRNFIIVKNETAVDLITSDDPVIKFTHSEIDHRLYELFIPINPKFGIWIIPKGFYLELDIADGILYLFKENDNIAFYNHLQVYQSTRQLFSIKPNFYFAKEVLEKNPNFRNINKKRLD